jgi:hypothetical protein
MNVCDVLAHFIKQLGLNNIEYDYKMLIEETIKTYLQEQLRWRI